MHYKYIVVKEGSNSKQDMGNQEKVTIKAVLDHAECRAIIRSASMRAGTTKMEPLSLRTFSRASCAARRSSASRLHWRTAVVNRGGQRPDFGRF
jgi:hypothetical protein